MGIADRDHQRLDYEPRRTTEVGTLSMWSITTWLIVINVAVFMFGRFQQARPVGTDPLGRTVMVIVQPVYELGAFTIEHAIGKFQLWRFISYQFLHGGLGHLLFNMFALYFFGPLIESYLGGRRYLAFYLISGVGGAVMYVLLWALGFPGFAAAGVLVGASAGIFGILIAAAKIAPNATVLLYGSIPAKLKTLAYVLIGIAVLTIFTRGANTGGEAAHLGGAVVGAVLIRNQRLLRFV